MRMHCGRRTCLNPSTMLVSAKVAGLAGNCLALLAMHKHLPSGSLENDLAGLRAAFTGNPDGCD